ncbi:hypothetical protein D2Q93_16135, partial [Alicyclobacillaceae bacterium I2511]
SMCNEKSEIRTSAGLQVDVWTTEQASVGRERLYLLAVEQLQAWGVGWVAVFRGIEGMTGDVRHSGWGWPWQRRSTPIRVMALDKQDNLAVHLPELSAMVGSQGAVMVQSVALVEDRE